MKSIVGHRKPGRRPRDVTDFPKTDWSLSLKKLQEVLGVGQRTAWRLRQEARALIRQYHPTKFKPARPGRRSYAISDFPGMDWTLPTRELIKKTGLSRVIVYRLVQEAGVDTSVRKLKRQTPISKTPLSNTNANLENPVVKHQRQSRKPDSKPPK